LNKQEEVAHLFRHEYGKLVALLVRRIGVHHIDLIEDAVQWAMAQALEFWCKEKAPNSPSAWLYQVAYRHILSEFRTVKHRSLLLSKHLPLEESEIIEDNEAFFSGEMSDSMLRMLFIACSNNNPIESQLVFTLKSLCGFNIREIALRLFISEANVYKRFSRAKKHLKNETLELDMLSNDEMLSRLPSVHRVLYLLFTEGYLSSHTDTAIRRDLCEEAIRLTRLLAESKIGDVANSYALLALMYFNLARINSRQNEFGVLLLLEQQDRNQWDKQQISVAMSLLAQSANGDSISRYHIEAGIAAEHCLSPSFEKTKWGKVVASYELLHNIAPSPLHLLNLAIATAEWKTPEAGLAVLKSADMPDWLERSYHWYAVRADLLFRCGELALADENADLAIAAAPTDSIKQLLFNRLK
jgi:RNA polymerase sigma-70 factor (ECF subfamily)